MVDLAEAIAVAFSGRGRRDEALSRPNESAGRDRKGGVTPVGYDTAVGQRR